MTLGVTASDKDSSYASTASQRRPWGALIISSTISALVTPAVKCKRVRCIVVDSEQLRGNFVQHFPTAYVPMLGSNCTWRLRRANIPFARSPEPIFRRPGLMDGRYSSAMSFQIEFAMFTASSIVFTPKQTDLAASSFSHSYVYQNGYDQELKSIRC